MREQPRYNGRPNADLKSRIVPSGRTRPETTGGETGTDVGLKEDFNMRFSFRTGKTRCGNGTWTLNN